MQSGWGKDFKMCKHAHAFIRYLRVEDFWIVFPVVTNHTGQKLFQTNWPRRQPRVTSIFFDEPSHEMLNGSIINYHFFINTYQYTKPLN